MRIIHLLYAGIAYAIFFATFLYLIAFVGDIWLAPVTIDASRMAPSPFPVITNLALIALFGIQHSVMARPGFKAAWTRIVPASIERGTYVLFSSLALIILMLFWQAMPDAVWTVENSLGAAILWALFALGWGIVLVSTFLINHFELFGLQQAWFALRNKAATTPVLRQPFFYKLVRHPIYGGFFIAFWATPAMSVGHLLFAAGMSVYILIGIRHEERDLVTTFGNDYVAYQGTVGMLIPGIGKRN